MANNLDPARVDILVVDDDVHVRSGLRETLQEAGLSCHVEEDGLRAFEWVRRRENGCRLILLDMATPKINGWQFLELRQKDPRISRVPVVVFSAMPLDRLKGLDVRAILRKPANPERVVSVVKKALEPATD